MSDPIIRPVYREKNLPLRIGMSVSHIKRLRKSGEFPAGHFISDGIRVWTEEEIAQWFEERIAKLNPSEAGEAA